MNAARVVLAHRSLLAGDTLARGLNATKKIVVTSTVHSTRQALHSAQDSDVDLLLADIAYGTGPLKWLCNSVLDQNPTVRVVVLGNVSAEIPDLIESGAVGAVSDELGPAELAETLQRIHRGELHHPMELAYRIAERIRCHNAESGAATNAGAVGHEPLTAREREVLTMIADGSSNKQIAHKLDIRVSTVKTHVHNLLAKLRVSRRRDASREGYLRGILQAPRPA